MSNLGGANFEVAEDDLEVTEDFRLPLQQPQISGLEQNSGVASFQQNMPSSGIPSHPLEDILPNASIEQQELHRVPSSSVNRNPSTGAIPKDTKASVIIRSDPNPDIMNPSDDPLALWEDTGAIPKYLTQEFAAKASKYLPPFKKPQSQRPKPETQHSLVNPPSQPQIADPKELHVKLQKLQRAEVQKELVKGLLRKLQRPVPIAAELPQEKPQSQRLKPKMQPSLVVPPSQPQIADLEELHAELQRAELRQELVEEIQVNPHCSEEQAAELPQDFQRPEVQQEPVKEHSSSPSEQAEFVRQHCLDFQDYKRTVNNKQKCLEQSLNLVLPKMNSAMVDAQNLAIKIEKVRSQDCETEEALKIQNDKMKYLVGRTVGTISKIDSLFDRFRTDILEYTTLTTEGNTGIDKRLSKLLMILCGMEDKDQEKEENKVIRDSFEQSDDS